MNETFINHWGISWKFPLETCSWRMNQARPTGATTQALLTGSLLPPICMHIHIHFNQLLNLPQNWGPPSWFIKPTRLFKTKSKATPRGRRQGWQVKLPGGGGGAGTGPRPQSQDHFGIAGIRLRFNLIVLRYQAGYKWGWWRRYEATIALHAIFDWIFWMDIPKQRNICIQLDEKTENALVVSMFYKWRMVWGFAGTVIYKVIA